MATPEGKAKVREAVAVFDDWSSLERAVDDLHDAGFRSDDISLLAGEETVTSKLGHRYERVQELEDDPDAPRTAFTSSRSIGRREDMVVSSLTVLPTLLAAGTVVASAGAVAAAIAGTASVGAAIGTAFARWMDKRHADWLQSQLDHGGILLWVRVPDDDAQGRAVGILRGHSAHDVHVHEIPAS